MIKKIFLPLLLVLGLAAVSSAQKQSNPCADLAKKHIARMDEYMDIDFRQMKCLRDVATRFCSANRSTPPENAAQRDKRLAKLREAILNCLDADQQNKIKTHFRNKQEEKRRSILDAFIEEFGDEVIVLHKGG